MKNAALILLLLPLAARADDRPPQYPRPPQFPTLPAAKAEPPRDPLRHYWRARQQSLADGLPLVVFVGLPQRTEIDAELRCCWADAGAFPGLPATAIVVAVPVAGTRRYTLGDGEQLAGDASEADILAAAHRQQAALLPKARVGNVGSCGCKADGSPCLCVPASRCPGGCPKPAAKPLSFAPTFSFGVCRT